MRRGERNGSLKNRHEQAIVEDERKLGRRTAMVTESSWRWNILNYRTNGARSKTVVGRASKWRWNILKSLINWETHV